MSWWRRTSLVGGLLISFCWFAWPQSTADEANRLLAEKKFQPALDLATSELKKTPNDWQLQFVAGASACGLGHFDIGIGYLLTVIRNTPDGVKYEHREALESCITLKHRAEIQQDPKVCKEAPQAPARTEFPSGKSFTFETDIDSCKGGRHEALKFLTDGSVDFSMVGCGDTPKFLRGRWETVGQIVYMEFLDQSQQRGSFKASLAAEIRKDKDGSFTLQLQNPTYPAQLGLQ